MVTEANIYSQCPKCKGTGIAITQKGEEDPCGMCNGKKGVITGFVDVTMIADELNDIMDKCNDIFEKVNEL